MLADPGSPTMVRDGGDETRALRADADAGVTVQRDTPGVALQRARALGSSG